MDEIKPLRSFGRRKGRRLSNAASLKYQQVLPSIQIVLDRVNGEPLFNEKVTEVWLEIGFGTGDHLVTQLQKHLHIGMIGCEPYINGISKLLNRLSQEELDRLRIFNDDIRLLLPVLPTKLCSRVFILFPDPWPKKRHHRRRLISQAFIDVLVRVLQDNAEIRIASDDEDYIRQVLEVFSANPSFVQKEGPRFSLRENWPSKPQGWPTTKYEEKAQKQGMSCAYLSFIYRNEL